MVASRSTRVIALFGLIACVLGLASWLVLGLGRRDRADTRVVDGVSVSAALEKPLPAADPLTAVELVPSGVTRTTPDVLRELPDGPLAAELEDAVWVTGRVEFPTGTPTDERVLVVAAGREFASKKLHRALVASDGTFKVAFAKGSRRASLRIEARYLFLEESRSVQLDPVETDVVLIPTLGGGLRGRVQPSSAAAAFRADVIGAQVTATGWKPGLGSARIITARIDSELGFELGGLDPAIAWNVSCQPPGFAQSAAHSVGVSAGHLQPLDLVLERGAVLKGTVRDESGTPIAQAALRSDAEAEQRGIGPRAGVRSDAAGRFEFPGLRSGAALIVVVADGCVMKTLEPLTLAEGEVRTGFDIVLTRGLSISGTVRWPDDKPAADIQVQAEPAQTVTPPHGIWFALDDPSTTTDEEGRFVITGLTAGTYAIAARSKALPVAEEAVERAGKRPPKVRHQARLTDVNAGTTGVALVLTSGNSVRGRVVDDRGAPLTAFTIDAFPERAGEYKSQTFTPKDGSFAIVGLADGLWTISASAKEARQSGEVKVQLPADTQPIELVVPRSALLRGVVFDPAGKPQPAAGLRIVRRDSELGHWTHDSEQQRTDANGAFALAVLPGALDVSAVHSSWAASEPVRVDIAPAAEPAPITLQLRIGGTVEGIVRDAEGRPAPQREITLRAQTVETISRTTDAQGNFRFEQVAPGKVFLTLQPLPAALAATRDAAGNVDWTAAMDFNSHATVTVVDGGTVSVELGGTMSAALKVTGVVRGKTLLADTKLRFFGPRDDPGLRPSAVATKTDQEGRYAITVPGSGAYSIVIDAPGQSAIATQVRIPPGPSFVLDLTLPSGTLAGRVVSGAGVPLAGIDVVASTPGSIMSDKGAVTIRRMAARTGADGTFVFATLSPGTYEIEAAPSQYLDGNPALASFADARVKDIVLSAGGLVDDIVLRLPRAATIRGVVRGTDGGPVAGAAIMARDLAQDRIHSWWDVQPTDAAGKFTIVGLTAGDHTVLARRGKDVAPESAVIRVREGETSDIVLVLQPGNTLDVACADQQGVPQDWPFDIQDEKGRDASVYIDLEERGEAHPSWKRVAPLPDGKYTLRLRGKPDQSGVEEVTLRGGVAQEVRLQARE